MDSYRVFRENYQFLDLPLGIETDSPDFIKLFRKLYRRFRLPSSQETQATYRLMQGDGVLDIDGQRVALTDRDLEHEQACERILDSLTAKVTSHTMIHAGAVSRDGHGVVLPAHTGYGKTTLVLALVQSGFAFLSDEIAAFDRRSGLLAPFPRSLRVRPGTLALRGLSSMLLDGSLLTDRSTMSWRGKLIVDTERIRPDSLGDTCRPGFVFILTNPAADPAGLDDTERTVYLLPDRITPALVHALRNTKGVIEITEVTDAASPVLALRAERGIVTISWAERLCQAEGVRMLDLIKGGAHPPRFAEPPCLEPISTVEAAMELFRGFRGGPASALVQGEFGGSASKLFLELADMIRNTKCYRLLAGDLEAMVELIHNTVVGG